MFIGNQLFVIASNHIYEYESQRHRQYIVYAKCYATRVHYDSSRLERLL